VGVRIRKGREGDTQVWEALEVGVGKSMGIKGGTQGKRELMWNFAG